MKKVLFGVLLAALGTMAWNRWHAPAATVEEFADTQESETEPEAAGPAPQTASFACDGRVYCSEMTSCDEAKYFLANCPGVKMDGEGDGIPCERQWCGSH